MRIRVAEAANDRITASGLAERMSQSVKGPRAIAWPANAWRSASVAGPGQERKKRPSKCPPQSGHPVLSRQCFHREYVQSVYANASSHDIPMATIGSHSRALAPVSVSLTAPATLQSAVTIEAANVTLRREKPRLRYRSDSQAKTQNPRPTIRYHAIDLAT